MSQTHEGGGVDLRPLRHTDEAEFRRAVEECSRPDPAWEFGLQFASARDFRGYVDRVNGWPAGRDLPDHFVPNTYRVAAMGTRLVGRVSIRHALTDLSTNVGGHVGYGVVPSHQGRGLATELLRMSLPLCLKLGLSEILVTCDEANIASRRVIEKNGGVPWDSIPDPRTRITKLRYWIDTRSPVST